MGKTLDEIKADLPADRREVIERRTADLVEIERLRARYDALVDELREIVAENERLRAANAGFREKNAELLSLIAKRMAERDEAQARLATDGDTDG